MNNPSILIVEDETIVAADLSSKLQQLGYNVSGATARGEDAVTLAREHRPDLVLMDIRLAGRMDGIEAAEQIRAHRRLPVIFLTAHADGVTVDRAKLTEPFGYITKPFEEQELRTHIELALHKHQAEQRLWDSEDRLRQLNAELEELVLERADQVRVLTSELRLAGEREQRRIAAILHDRLQPLLVGARLQLEEAGAATNLQSQQGCLRIARELLDESSMVSRQLSNELSTPSLGDIGLAESLRWLAGWMQERHGLSVVLGLSDDGPPVRHDLKLLLFHSVRELLLNVVKHAGVQQAAVTLVRTDTREIDILVSDRGCGFEMGPSARQLPGGGLGLIVIRDWLLELDGRMEVQSEPGCGCQVRLVVAL